jgi:hypothetical protein
MMAARMLPRRAALTVYDSTHGLAALNRRACRVLPLSSPAFRPPPTVRPPAPTGFMKSSTTASAVALYRLGGSSQLASRCKLLSQQEQGSASGPDQAGLHRPPLALLLGGVRFHARQVPRAQAADPDTASVFRVARLARDRRSRRPLSRTWSTVAVAPARSRCTESL